MCGGLGQKGSGREKPTNRGNNSNRVMGVRQKRK